MTKPNTSRRMMVAAAVRNRRREMQDDEMMRGRYMLPDRREMRQRDSRGRYMMDDAYNTGDYPEMRRQRDSRGRYMMDDDPQYEPMYRRPMIGYDRDSAEMLMPMEYDRRMPNRMSASKNKYDGDIYARGSIIMSPNRTGDMEKTVDEYTAMRWIKSMEPSDGGDPMHFKMEQSEQYRNQIAPECNPYEFWVAMNMMYSDYGAVARKVGVDKNDYYAHMAKAFLCDKDAGANKLRKYMETIPE